MSSKVVTSIKDKCTETKIKECEKIKKLCNPNSKSNDPKYYCFNDTEKNRDKIKEFKKEAEQVPQKEAEQVPQKEAEQVPQKEAEQVPQKEAEQNFIEKFLMEKAEIIKKEKDKTVTKPGSIKYLLFGSELSEQSLSIKMGKIGEEMVKKIIDNSKDFELLECGVQCIDIDNKKNKDIDLLWINHKLKIIYYREAKGNIELDSEKLPATIDKMKEIIKTHISPKYPSYTNDVGIFNWSIYNRKELKSGLSHIKKCEEKGIKIEHPEDLFKLLNFNWNEENYYKFFRKLGKYLRK